MNRPMAESLRRATAEAMRQTALQLDARFTEEISAVKWTFPTPPRVRDIVDTGRLRASQTRTTAIDGTTEWRWPVEYAAEVHEGGTTHQGLRFPGRPWTKAPLAELPQRFAANLNRILEASG